MNVTWCTVNTGARTQCGTRRYSRPCWQDDESGSRESPAADIDDAASSSSCTWRSTSRCSSASGGARTPSSSSTADPVEEYGRSSPSSSDGRSVALRRHFHRSRSAVERSYSPAARSTTATDGRSWLQTQRCFELSSPSDDLLDLLQQPDRGPGGACDCTASAGNCFEGRVGSLRRRRRSTVTPELMQVDRERAAASPTVDSVTPSPSHQRTSSPEPPSRSTRRRLLPQPDRAAALERASSATGNKDADLSRLASAVSSRYFVPISKHRNEERESNMSSARRLSLGVDTGVGETLASLAAASVAVSTSLDPHNRRMFDEPTAIVTKLQENNMNFPTCSSLNDSRQDNAKVLPNATTAMSPHRQHRGQYLTSTATETVHADDDQLLDLPQDDHDQQFTRSTFRSSTLPQRWKSYRPDGELPKLANRRELRELWATQTASDIESHVSQPQSSLSDSSTVNIDSNSNQTSTQGQATSASTLTRVEALRDRFRRLSEMYKNSLEEDSAVMFTKTKKLQKNDVDKDITNEQSARDTDITGTEGCEVGLKATSAGKTATTVVSDTESQSSCGRDEGFESETATSSVVSGTDTSSLQLHHVTDDAIAPLTAAVTEATVTVCSEANLFASSIDSIVRQTSPRSFDERTTFSEVASAGSPSSSSVGTSSTDEVAYCNRMPADKDAAVKTSASNRQSRINQQRAFAERMSAPRRSVTRSPQRRAPAASSDTTSRSGLYSSPMVRRKTRTSSSNGPSPPPRDYSSLAVGAEQRRKSDAGEVDGSAERSRFVRGSVARTSLPHYGIFGVRAPGGARPTTSKDQKQPLRSSVKNSSSNQTYKSAGKTAEWQTVKAATGLCHTHVDRNGVQAMKASSVARVFSTPVRFGPTSQQTRPAAAVQRPNTGDENHNDGPPMQRDVSTDGRSQRVKNEQLADNRPEATSAPRISERKSVFERLFEKSQHRRYSKSGANNVTAAPAVDAQTGSRQGQAAESHEKPSTKRPNTTSTNSVS